MIRPTSHLLRLHRDDRGNIGVLLLLTIFALVALLALVWNTGEVATRRETLQTAADTSAHAAATWVARCTNLVTAQNMVICQDASEETIWRTITPTDQRVSQRLNAELTAATNMLNNNDPQYQNLRNQMLNRVQQVDNEYAIAQGAWSDVTNFTAQQSFPDPQTAQQFQTTVRQAGEVLTWIENTYVNGQPAASARLPGPPGPNGQGLRQLVEQWSAPQNVAPFLQAIIASLQQQLAVLQQFEATTAPALAQDVPTIAANHEAEVFKDEQDVRSQLPATVQQQVTQQAGFYSANLTLATTGRGAQSDGPAQMQPPMMQANDPTYLAPVSHPDSIRGIDVQIDPINVHADLSSDEPGPLGPASDDPSDARIWYPNIQAPTPANLIAQFPHIQQSFTINCNIPGGWGHSYCAPLRRYVNARVANDQQGLCVYMQSIDNLRNQLAQTLCQLRGLSQNESIASLPAQLSDTVPDPQNPANFPLIPVPPRLTAPANASDQLIAAITLYNQHAAAYTGAVRGLANALVNWARFFDRFTQPFAVSTWQWQVTIARIQVLRQLGINKQFMVLATYRLGSIPQWAQAGMSVSAEAAIRDRIVTNNLGPVSRAILGALVGADPNGAGAGFLDPTSQNIVLSAIYSPEASQIAFQIVNSAAAEAAPIIAAEWVSRPWAYEITPPDTQVPPSQGMTTPDRQTYFTLLAAAQPTDATGVKFFLPKLMGAAPNIVTYAQAESFNWMEFNSAYGGSEIFDQVTPDSDAYFIGAPNPWRLSTVGGWNWQPRLAVSDALSPALDNNPELQTFFQEGGVPNNDPDAIQTITLH